MCMLFALYEPCPPFPPPTHAPRPPPTHPPTNQAFTSACWIPSDSMSTHSSSGCSEKQHHRRACNSARAYAQRTVRMAWARAPPSSSVRCRSRAAVPIISASSTVMAGMAVTSPAPNTCQHKQRRTERGKAIEAKRCTRELVAVPSAPPSPIHGQNNPFFRDTEPKILTTRS